MAEVRLYCATHALPDVDRYSTSGLLKRCDFDLHTIQTRYNYYMVEKLVFRVREMVSVEIISVAWAAGVRSVEIWTKR